MSIPTPIVTEEQRLQAIGREGPPMTMEVERGAIIKFAEAIGDENPLWNDEAVARRSRYGGLIAPPTFLRSLRVGLPELPFEIPFDRRLDGGSDWEYFQPVRPGDRIQGVARVTDLRERSGRMGLMIFMTSEITYRNQFDEVVATQTSTSILY